MKIEYEYFKNGGVGEVWVKLGIVFIFTKVGKYILQATIVIRPEDF